MLSTDLYDFLEDANGELVLDSDLQFSSGIEAVAQSLKERVMLVRGEWFADLDLGVDYYGDLLGQKFNEPRAREAFRSVIIDTPNVVELVSLTVTFDGPTRALAVSWKVRTEFGDTADSAIINV